MHKLIGVILAISVALLTASAAAQTNEEKARVQFEQGVALFDDEKYEQAAIAFEQAYALNPSFKILWNIAQTENLLGHYAAALDAYKHYLREGETRIPVSRAAKARKEILRLEALVGAIRIECPIDGAVVFISGRKQGTTPLADPVLTDLGEHEVILKLGGRPIHRELVKVAGGQEVLVEIQADSAAEALEHGIGGEEAEEEEGAGGKRVWTWVALGVGGAAAVAGGVIGGVVLKKSGELDDSCPDGQCPSSEWDNLDSANSLATASSVLLGVGAGMIAVGVVLFFVEPGLGEEEQVALVPTVTADGAGLALGGRF
jgi:hypothetical protein